MKIGSLNLPNVKPQHAWILPLISLIAWWAMLLAMMIIWFAQGRPDLGTYHPAMSVYIVYLSNTADSKLQPIFIVGSGIMGIFFVWSVIEDYYLRTREKQYLPLCYHWMTTALHALAISLSIIASLCILLVSCLRDNWQYSYIHSVFVILFVIFVFSYLCAHTLVFLFYYKKYHIKYFLIISIVKLIWVLVAIVLVVCYGVFMGLGNSQGNDSVYWGYSGIMEWSLVYFYGTMFILISFDLRQSSYGKVSDWMANDFNGHEHKGKDQESEEYSSDLTQRHFL
ncbi:Sfk1 protein [Martiniozyma asiatica (nom. inval.)]|nr:Sfk1 protein [Martiniozyma asiatica]